MASFVIWCYRKNLIKLTFKGGGVLLGGLPPPKIMVGEILQGQSGASDSQPVSTFQYLKNLLLTIQTRVLSSVE